MPFPRTLTLALLAGSCWASPAAAQTTPRKAKSQPTTKAPSTRPKTKTAADQDPLKGRSSGRGQSGYAAPGEPMVPPSGTLPRPTSRPTAPPSPATKPDVQSGYVAPGMPQTPTTNDGKNTPAYDGRPAKPAPASTTLPGPK